MNMKRLILFILTGIFCLSCQDEKRTKSENIVKEWTGKTIRLPSDVELYYPEGDSIAPQPPDSRYKIFLYTDSTGCTSCKLKPYLWTQFIEEIDSLMPGQVEFLFYFHPKDRRELTFLLKRDGFRYPVFIDDKNKVDRQNHFPSEMEYQCFLLDRENHVLSIGNPTLNPKIGDLYKRIIGGDDAAKGAPLTTVEVGKPHLEIENLKKGQESSAVFTLTNTGQQPLVIARVDASCGCTVPLWDKQPISSQRWTEIKVKVTPEQPGFFEKTVTVYCNTKEQSVVLKISGMVDQ